jgi:membrane protein YdbS with pleckstrin-like domain
MHAVEVVALENQSVNKTAFETSNSTDDRSTTNDSVFPTRIDAWLVILVGVAFALCLRQAWSLRGASFGGGMIALAIGIASVITVLALTLPCRYTLKDDHLFIHCGMIKKRIRYAEIHRVESSSNPLSAPALSLRRVRIDHGRSFTLVSPLERGRFIEELLRRCGLTS